MVKNCFFWFFWKNEKVKKLKNTLLLVEWKKTSCVRSVGRISQDGKKRRRSGQFVVSVNISQKK